MNLQKNTIYIIASSIMLGLGVIFFSLAITQYQVLTGSRAEFDGTACNDNIGDTLNPGSTSWDITCTGNLNRGYRYFLFWCPDMSKTNNLGYCGDIRDPGNNAYQLLDQSDGIVIPGSMSKSTNKDCGCIQWDVAVTDSTGTEDLAGGVLICADNPCEEPTPPPNTPVPTAPQDTPVPTAPQDTPVPTAPQDTPVPTAPQDTPVPTAPQDTPVPTNSPTPTATDTPTPTPSDTPTPTPTPSDTPTPIPTDTPTPVPTETPVPTATPVPPTDTPIPTPTTQQIVVVENTPTPVTKLAVEDQSPGFNPWFALLIPFGLVILGLAL